MMFDFLTDSVWDKMFFGGIFGFLLTFTLECIN